MLYYKILNDSFSVSTEYSVIEIAPFFTVN